MKKWKILLIEDNPAHVLITREAFAESYSEESQYSIDITNVNDGIDALMYLSNCKTMNEFPDLLIIDINLPQINGLDLLKKIKSHKDYKHIPAIIVTNGTRNWEIHDAYSRYANAFIIKPFKYDDFLEMIELMKEFWFEYAIMPTKIIGGSDGE